MNNNFRKLLNGDCIEKTFHLKNRIMERIKIGEYELSIQASKFHYCTPRETITDLYKYKEMEVAIFNKDAWVDLEEDTFFSNWKHRNKFLQLYDGMVAGYVSIDIIQSLYNYTKDNINKKQIKYKKRVINRQKLYEKRKKLGRL